MQRHRHQRPISGERLVEPGIGEGLGSETSEILGEMKFAAVFQSVNHVERAIVPDHGRTGELEEKLQFAAIRAIEHPIDLPFERLATAPAKGLYQPGQVRVAAIKQGAAIRQSLATDRAERRVEQVQRAGQPFPPTAGLSSRWGRRHPGQW
jgi:hypothetical protein